MRQANARSASFFSGLFFSPFKSRWPAISSSHISTVGAKTLSDNGNSFREIKQYRTSYCASKDRIWSRQAETETSLTSEAEYYQLSAEARYIKIICIMQVTQPQMKQHSIHLWKSVILTTQKNDARLLLIEHRAWNKGGAKMQDRKMRTWKTIS